MLTASATTHSALTEISRFSETRELTLNGGS